MKGFGWLRKLRKDQRGNALLIGAAVLPLMLGAGGLAIDTIQLGVWKRQLQRAADSSAIAGVYAMTQDRTATQNQSVSNAVHADLDQNVFPTLAQQESVTPGPFGTYQEAVQVGLVARHRLPFMSIFTGGEFTISANSAAALISDGRFCVLSLYDGTAVGIDVGGNAAINLACGVASNSRSATAVVADGSSQLTASPVMAVGGISGSSNFAAGTVLQPRSAEQADPFRHITPTPPTVPCVDFPTMQPNDPPRIEPEGEAYDELCFNGVSTSGRWDLGDNAGRNRIIYIWGGNLDFGAQANVSCTGCTFVLTGPNGRAGDFLSNGHPTMNIIAPTTGIYANIAIFRDRRAAPTNVVVNGGAGGLIEGALYFPTSNVQMNGNAGFNVRCFQLIGQLLEFRGNAGLTNQCDRTGSGRGFGLQYVRLVG